MRVRRKKRQGSETRKIGGWIEIGDGPANFRGLARRDLNRPALPEASQSVAGFLAWQTVKCSRKIDRNSAFHWYNAAGRLPPCSIGTESTSRSAVHRTDTICRGRPRDLNPMPAAFFFSW